MSWGGKGKLATLAIVSLVAAGPLWFTVGRDQESSRVRNLDGSEFSPQALTERFLEALESGDLKNVVAHALDREEFEQIVWPRLPHSRPGTNLTPEFVWGQTVVKSLSALGRTFSDHGTRHYRLLKLRFAAPTQDYGTFVLHRDPWLRLRDENGNEKNLRLFGSVLEKDGEFKFYSFVND